MANLAARAGWYKWYVLALLFVVALFNYIDRSILSILQEPIKAELGLTDTHLGALTGLTFALFYTTMGLPIARLADRTSYKVVLAIAVTLWCVMTALCGAAAGFFALFVCRVGVALGESAGAPTSHALIAEYFPLGRRSTAMGIWGLAVPLGGMIGVGFAGWLNHLVGWRSAFYLLGVAGALLGPVVYLTVAEPLRAKQKAGEAAVNVKATIRALWNLKTYRYLTLGGLFNGLAAHPVQSWIGPFYARRYELPLIQVGLYVAIVAGLGGVLGTYLAGAMADRLGRNDRRWYTRVPAIAALFVVPLGLVQYLVPNLVLSLVLGTLVQAMLSSHVAPAIGTIQSLVSPKMRAFASAVFVLGANVLGLALGPLLVGMASDILIGQGLTKTSLGIAISFTLGGPLLGGLFYARASRSIRTELAAAGERDAQAA
jgi:MFS family permease